MTFRPISTGRDGTGPAFNSIPRSAETQSLTQRTDR